MITCNGWPIGVCSWSLGNDIRLLNDLRCRTGVDRLHLWLNPFYDELCRYSCRDLLQDGWTMSATMVNFRQEDYTTLQSIKLTGGVVPDTFWEENKSLVLKAIETTASLAIPYLEFHIGFIDLSEPDYARKMEIRTRTLADAALKNNIMILLETGQETAQTLRAFLKMLNHPSLGVNFDPGNMILYGKGRPVKVLELLSPWIRHLHIKDAVSSGIPGKWGTESVWGCGEVHPETFLCALKRIGYSGTLSIEREAGGTRLEDIEMALKKLSTFQFKD